MRGWKALTVLLGLIVVFCGVGTWAFITWIAPLIFSTAQLWPTGPNELWRWLCIGGTIAGIVLGFTIDRFPAVDGPAAVPVGRGSGSIQHGGHHRHPRLRDHDRDDGFH